MNEFTRQMMAEKEMLEEQARLQREAQAHSQSMQNMSTAYGNKSESDMVKYQLDLTEELERIYHLLRGDIAVIQNNEMFYIEQTDPNLKPFNEHGVQMIMNIMTFYLNKNTILSNYDEKIINWKVHDFSKKITNLLYTKCFEMGMDTEDKQKYYPMICLELVDTVHSAYLRALRGGERDSLRKTMHFSQVGNPLMNNQMLRPKEVKKFQWHNPTTWF